MEELYKHISVRLEQDYRSEIKVGDKLIVTNIEVTMLDNLTIHYTITVSNHDDLLKGD